MGNSSQTPPFNGYMPSGSAPEFPEFSTQITIANEVTPNLEDTTPKSKKHPQPTWNTEQNLVLISGWIKFSTSSVVGRNQKRETYWNNIADYCKWIGAYDGAKRLQGSGWSENDVLAKAHEIYACGSSGSKRSHESDACGSNSVGFSARPIGRDAAKKKGKKKASTPTEVVDKEWDNYMKMKEKEMEHLAMVVSNQQEKNKLKKMKMYLKLSSDENLDDRKKAMLDTLAQELFP
ncbi:uncharacterized protein LOC123895970 [Trifolium pratense]|uniref:uncharacterized protein LOC123895970 n=1 Tax=Trifolium pratense TaxID=57577 RepID=UPI001E690594|nr:uncharacterized protein LOC123895970 [Trifolium pratense]